MKAIATCVIVLMLEGCAASGYSQFYTTFPEAGPEAMAAARIAPPPAVPNLEYATGTFDDIMGDYARHAYAPFGYSAFSSGRNESEKGALQQGSKVGADLVVVIEPKYLGSTTTSIPITTPSTETSYTSSSATAYGAGSSVTAYGDSTTTTYGSRTNYIPMTVNRYEYGAIYFIKWRPIFGATFDDLSDAERRDLQTNRGASVLSIVDGSPAYMSDVLVGDVILAVNGQPVNDGASLSVFIAKNHGRTIEITIARGGERLTKSVNLAR